MELIFATKGIKKDADDFINQLVGKWLPFQWRENKKDKFENRMVQLSIRPVQLWVAGFPKEHKDVICTTILGKEGGKARGNDGTKPVEHKFLNKFIFLIRKLLHLKPIGEYKSDFQLPINRGAVAVVGIGIKEDYTMPNGVEGL
jgi:hypothetical protein